jgi:D-apiose dehydrogenase
MPPPLRGAIAGCGFFGRIHLEAWSRVPQAIIVASCDPDLSRAHSFAPNAYTNIEDLLDAERPDFLDITSRPEHHLALTRAAAARSIPVICQKPLAPSWADCLEIVRTARRARIPFMVHENWRFQPWYRAIARLREEHSLGQPITYTFRTRRRDGIGPDLYPTQPYFTAMPRFLLYEALVHHLDTARFLFGDIATIYAHLRRIHPAIAGEDQALLTVTHHDGLAGLIDGNRHTDLAPNSPSLGDALFEFENAALALRPNGSVAILKEGMLSPAWTNDVTEGYRGDSVRATCTHFAEKLLAGEPFETAGLDYLQSVAAVEAGYRSAETKAQQPVLNPQEILRQLDA